MKLVHWQIFTVALCGSMVAVAIQSEHYTFAIAFTYLAVVNAVFAERGGK